MSTLETPERAAKQNGGGADNQIPVENPATGQVIAHVPDMGADEVKALVEAARAAQPAWAAMNFDARAKVFQSEPGVHQRVLHAREPGTTLFGRRRAVHEVFQGLLEGIEHSLGYRTHSATRNRIFLCIIKRRLP